MPETRDRWLFAVTLASAAMVLVSIAAAESLLAMAALGWLLVRPGRMIWPSYAVPLAAFMLTTVISLAMSPQPEIGMSVGEVSRRLSIDDAIAGATPGPLEQKDERTS